MQSHDQAQVVREQALGFAAKSARTNPAKPRRHREAGSVRGIRAPVGTPRGSRDPSNDDPASGE